MSEQLLSVYVDLRNDAGDYREQIGCGYTVDEAVASAETAVRDTTGDDSWTMDDWRARY